MRRWPLVLAGLVLVASASLAGCGSGIRASVAPSPSAVTQTAAPTEAPTETPTAVPTATPQVSPVPTPPLAALRVEGGDPVEGQLGTYVWDDAGSDSPWLPGSPISAASGEPMSVTLSPSLVPSTWSVVIAPAANGDGSGATKIGDGTGAMEVTAPAPGTWTLAITTTFEDHGSATWFWLLEVS